MPIHYYDTSALAKRYFVEAGSERINALLSDPDGHVCSRLALVEVSAAICRRAHPRGRDDLLKRFDSDAAHVFAIAEIDAPSFDTAIMLVRRHALRGCDALQLAAALRIFARDSEMVFICADGDLNTAASAEGLRVIDPNK